MTSFDPTFNQTTLIETLRNFASSDLRAHLRSSDDYGLLREKSLRAGWGFRLTPASPPVTYGAFADEDPSVTRALAYKDSTTHDCTLNTTSPE